MAKNPLPYFPHYASEEWLISTLVAGMSPAAKGIYMTLLCHQWIEEGLPNDEDRLTRLSGASTKEWSSFQPFLNEAFPVCEDGRRRNLGLVNKHLEAAQKSAIAREKGGKGGRPRKQPVAKLEETSEKPAGFLLDIPEVDSSKPIRDLEIGLKKEGTNVPSKEGGEVLLCLPPWWIDDPDPIVRVLAQGIASTELKSKKRPYTELVPDRDQLLWLADRWRKWGGTHEDMDLLINDFHDYHAKLMSPKYRDLSLTMKSWTGKREASLITRRSARERGSIRHEKKPGILEQRERIHALIEQQYAEEGSA